jgi:hypothetical protein
MGESMFGKGKKTEFLMKKLDEVNERLEKSNLEEIAYLMGDKKEIFFRNFFAGISRGVGIGIGVTFITAILILLLERIVKLNIPVIGEYVTDIVNIVLQQKY